MKKNIAGSLLCSVLLVGCTGLDLPIPGLDGGLPGGDGGDTGGRTPPSVAEGEAALDVYDESGKHELRCSTASQSFSANVQQIPDSAGGGAGFTLFCNDASGDGATLQQRAFQIGVYDDALTPGTYDVFPETGVAIYDTFTFNIVDEGEGISLGSSPNGGVTFDGTFTVTENAGSGGAFKATFAITYPRVSVVTGGVATELVDREGEAVGAIHVVLP